MKPPKPRYPGDAAIDKLMARYGCPTPFHVVRMRALGEIVSLKSRTNPIDVIKSFWGDGFPSFEDEAEANRFFNLMLAQWNHMARHWSGRAAGGSARAGPPRVKLSKTGRLRNWDDITTALRRRAEEIRDGFLAGFAHEPAAGSHPGAGPHPGAGSHPQALNDAIAGLKALADQFDQAAKQIDTDREHLSQLPIDDTRRMITQGTAQVEQLLDVLCTVARAIAGTSGAAGESGEGRVH